jgi:alpha-glucosidase
LKFKGDYSLVFRAYNDGVAYRWVLNKKEEIIVRNEQVSFVLENQDSVYFPDEESFLTHSERLYPLLAVKDISEQQMASMPVLVKKPNGIRVAITESDLLDYPGMYLKGSESDMTVLSCKFPSYPAREEKVSDRTIKVSETEDFIAKTSGTRSFPWRVMIIADDDGKLVESDMVYRLASQNRLKETDWIKPGKVAWDWWNALNIYGVDFESGLNTATYKYYIDFASEYGIPYIILDEGWSDTEDLFSINPDIDLPELFRYAKSKNVGIILWVVWSTLDEQLAEAMDKFQDWGVKGIKVDFMQRDDQKMVNYYEKISREAADHKLMVDFHGSYKPTGLRRTYPNVMTREGLRGLEHSKWSDDITPEHDLILPFTRMLAGPMDFTPGAMINCTADQFKAAFNRPMSQGTRCHQLAMYVVYESPLQMLADSPSNYYKEPETMEFLKQVPVTWDETIVPQAKVGEYILVIRQKDDKWYIGAMTNWEARTMEVDLSFLPPGDHQITIWQDGPNADKNPEDLKMDELTVQPDGKLFIKLAPGGGFVGVIE